MSAGRPEISVVIPTIGRERLGELVATIAAGEPSPTLIVVADDRSNPVPALALPEVSIPVDVVHSGGRGPAAARNAGWLVTDTEWVAFVDDDVRLAPDWCAALARDLSDLPCDVGASWARIEVPPPADRRPTDEERRTTALASAHWITADMAYRRTALLATGGFDERFPRAFREDSDLALRTVRAGFRIVGGDRVTEHPIRSRGGWLSSVRAQAGNADNALLRAKFGPRWRRMIGEVGGRTGRHLLTVGSATAAVAAVAARRPGWATAGLAAWAALTAEFALRRILPGPRTAAEIATMISTSAVIPPVALAYRAAGELRVRRLSRPRPVRAVLFDRDGTLIHDVPYLADPDRVQPVPGARDALVALRRRGLSVGVVSNQSGVARGLIRPEQLSAVNCRVDALLGPFDTWQTCPHGPDDHCECRKPEPGLVQAAARELGIEPEECLVIGDIGADVQAAIRAGAQAVLVPTSATRPAEIEHARLFAAVADTLAEAVDRALAGAR